MYPYFIYPDIIALRDPNTPPGNAETHRRRIAANVGDLASLRRILNLDPADFARFYPDQSAPSLSTSQTIDSFLSHYAPKSSGSVSCPMGQGLPASNLDRGANAVSANAPQNLSSLLKNHDYQAALKLLLAESLNNPEKSIYFADQIRFVKKLIFIQSKKCL